MTVTQAIATQALIDNPKAAEIIAANMTQEKDGLVYSVTPMRDGTFKVYRPSWNGRAPGPSLVFGPFANTVEAQAFIDADNPKNR